MKTGFMIVCLLFSIVIANGESVRTLDKNTYSKTGGGEKGLKQTLWNSKVQIEEDRLDVHKEG